MSEKKEVLKSVEEKAPEIKPSETSSTKKFGILANPWIFVPAIYLVQGLIEGGILLQGTGIMYKDFGYSNAFIGGLALLNLPLIFAFLWAPYVDAWGSKRNLSVFFFFTIAIGMAGIAAAVYFQLAFTVTTLLAFFFIAVILSFFRVATDGYYIRILSPKLQAEFVGVKAAGIRIGMMGTLGIFIVMAGKINEAFKAASAEIDGMVGFLFSAGKIGTPALGWFWMFIFLTIVILVMAVYNFFFLPRTPHDKPVKHAKGFPLMEVLKEYLQQDKVIAIIIFILIYRFGQGLLTKMADPFFMDPIDKNGMGLTIANLSMIRTAAGIPFMIIGGIAGGFIIKKWGLKKTFIPLAILMAIPNLGYWVLSNFHSTASFAMKGFEIPYDIFAVMSIESLGYGMGFSGFFYFIHAIATGKNKTSTFAISTALMGLGWNIPCAISGVIQEATSYETIFILSVVLSIPGIALIPFLPMPELKGEHED